MSNDKINEIILNRVMSIKGYLMNARLLHLLNSYPNIKTYLENLVDHYDSYNEIIYRIINNDIEQHYCPTCGKPLKYGNLNRGWYNHCSYRCATLDPEVHNKIVNTSMKRYGVKNGGGSKEAIAKIKKTKLERYGNENYANGDKIRESFKNMSEENRKRRIDKIQKTTFERYGKHRKKIFEKIKKTNLQRYGKEFYTQTEEYKKSAYSKIEKTVEKRNETKRKNGTFNTSSWEDKSYDILKEKYPDIVRQYRDNIRYPWCCDFYIPSKDLFIECNYGWTHGGHPYDENNPKDADKLNKWKERYGNYWWHTWVEYDPKKRNKAKENNLNFIEIWTVRELEEMIERGEI
ncbi:MAG: hypothetical protein J6D03_00860 [Clostridia bacterium]|nr:hypothetical protein [Clostridia bacterium]